MPLAPAVQVLGASTSNPAAPSAVAAPSVAAAPSARVNHGDDLDCDTVGGHDGPSCDGKHSRS